MRLKDATRNFGSVGLLLPLFLIFLIAVDSAYACPGNGTRVVYRTRTINSRTTPLMGTTVISYGGQPCGDISYNNTRRVRYVTVGGVSYYNSGPRYVAVRRSDSYYPAMRTRYVAVRNDDYDDAPRYVAVRRQPAYVDSGMRYVAVRDYAPRVRYVTARYNDMDDVDYDYAPHYAAVRRVPVYDSSRRYLAVRHVDSDFDDDDYVAPARYVAVRNAGSACACGVSSLDDVETIAPRHVVVKTDYVAGTQDVIVPRPSYNDTAYLEAPVETLRPARYVNDSDAAYWDDSNQRYIPATYVEGPRARTISYAPAYEDSDFDDEAIPDTVDASYIAADDVGDACLSRVAVQAPMETSMQTVSYIPSDEIGYDTSLSGSDADTYVVNNSATPANSYVPVSDEDNDMDTNYIAANNIGNSCSCAIGRQTFEDDIGFHTITPISTSNYEAVNTVPVDYTPVENVNYVPADETNVERVSYVPAASVGYADTADTDAYVQPISETSVITEPAAIEDTSMAIVDEDEADLTADLNDTQRAAFKIGYRDGFMDGKNAALNGEENRPADAVNFQNATNGYDDTLGDISMYSDAYRSSYLRGFSAGYDAETGP